VVADETLAAFERVDIRCGTIVQVEAFPEARKPAYKLTVDFGEPLGRRRSSAQIVALYAPADLIGTQVLAVINFPKKRIAGFESEVLVLGLPDESGNVVLLRPERQVPSGGRVY
jgi:tRNA-binding protein